MYCLMPKAVTIFGVFYSIGAMSTSHWQASCVKSRIDLQNVAKRDRLLLKNVSREAGM